jgi:AraC-like DNA-binding protein
MLRRPEIIRALESSLIHAMVSCLETGLSVEPKVGYRRQIAVMNRFEEVIESNPDRSLYLAEVCESVGASEKTLRRCCQEHLGMGPLRYLWLRRMHLARRALLRADPATATVTSVVTAQGFWELGRFSVAYRSLFGETPSESLRHSADERPAPRDPLALPEFA